VAAAWLFHGPLLGGLARPLIAHQPAGDFNCIGVIARTYGPDGDRCYDVAGELFREKTARRVLLVGFRPGRLVEIGVLPSFEESGRREFARRGVPPEAISVAPGDGGSYRATAGTLAAWLRNHPDASVLLFCSQFRSAHLRRALDAVLGPAQSGQVRLRPLPDRRFNETNWWMCRPGFREFGIAWLMRLQGWLGGGQAVQPPQESADDYERDFLRGAKK
jgi:hypothetical protein